jgi:hypothetical protein
VNEIGDVDLKGPGPHFTGGFQVELAAQTDPLRNIVIIDGIFGITNGVFQPFTGDIGANLLLFDLTIGNTSWSQDQPHSAPLLRIADGILIGMDMTLTNTLPQHPDLIFNLPASDGAFSAIDEVNGTNNGILFGTYQITEVSAVPEPSGLILLGLGLAGLGLLRRRGAAGSASAWPGA